MILGKPPGMQAVTVCNPKLSRVGSNYQLDWIPSMRTVPRTWGLVKGSSPVTLAYNLYFVAQCPLASCVTSLSLRILVCKMSKRTVLQSAVARIT